ncbi:MAG TPA: ThuA domain-containing protein, partial [Gemmataceae bacterium]|nr:ThuA domain-containing protein [Gemmataceae bacterium]
MTGESRGKLYRTQLVKTASGYVARNHLIACLSMLTIDCCVSPDGSLVVACHSGGPDWGSGPAGKGKLFKITYADKDHPQPVFAWPAGPREVRVEFDRPVDPQLLRDVLANTKLTAGKYVRAGDRFETLWPGYAVVQAEKASPRFDVPVRSAQLTPDRRTLVLATDPMTAAVHYALTLPGMGRKVGTGELPQHAAIDLDFDLTGCEATWAQNGKELWRGWLPHLDLDVSRTFTTGSAPHESLWKLSANAGELTLKSQLNLAGALRPAVQPGSKLDHEPLPEQVTLAFEASGSAKAAFPGLDDAGHLSIEGGASRSSGTIGFTPAVGRGSKLELRFFSPWLNGPKFALTFSTAEDKRARPLQVHRSLVPWADMKPDAFGKELALAPPKELDGGSWARGRKEFFGNDAACSKCHAINGQGGLIGPDLTNLVHRDYASVFRDVTQPSFALNPDYIPQTINLHSGKQLLGVVRTIDGKLHVGDKDGQTAIIDKADIEAMKPSGVSIMPDDLLKKLGPDRTRNLLTFLLVQSPSMPRDYAGSEKRPKPRTLAEVNAALAGAPNPPEKTKRIRVVLVAGAKDHGKGEHDYPAWLKAWEQLLSAGDNIDVVTAMEWPAKEEFQKADAMVFYQYGDWNEKRAADIDAFLERGGGLTYIHWAVAGRKDAAGFAKRIGLASGLIKFRHGPLDLTFNKEARHPIARNIDKMALVDESYWMLTGELPKDRVIAWGTEEKEPRPLFWSLEHGKGRVFVSIPGHYSWSFDDPLFRVLLLRGIAWSAHEPVDRFND